jgi:hypothetical protein
VVAAKAEDKHGFEGVVEGVKLGLGSALDPWSAVLKPKDFYTRERSAITMITEGLTHLAAGRGVAMGAGALLGIEGGPLGAAGGALAGNILYGLYAGVGEEYSRSQAVGQDFSVVRAAGQSLLEINPLFHESSSLIKLLGLGSKVGTLARVGAEVAGRSGMEYTYSHNTSQAAVVGAVGLVLAYPAFRGMRAIAPKSLPTGDTAGAIVRALNSEVGTDIMDRAAAKVAKAVTAVDVEDVDFQRYATGGTGQSVERVAEAFGKITDKMTPDKLQDQWKLFQHSKALVESAGEVVADLTAKLGGKIDAADLRTRDLAALKDAKFVGAALDRKTGLNTEGLFDAFARAKESFQVKAFGYMAEGSQLDAVGQKLGVTRTDIGKALGGRLSELAPDVQTKLTSATIKNKDGQGLISLKDAWGNALAAVRDQIRSSGYDVGHLEDYIPLKQLRGVDLAEALRGKLTDLQATALAAGKKSLLDLGDHPDFVEYKDTVARLLRRDPGTLTDGDLIGAAKSALGQAKTSLGYSPSAVYERLGEGMPDWSREWDIGKLYTQYVHGNLKAVEFDTPFKLGQTYLTSLRAMGLKNAGDYVENYLNDMSGGAARGLAGAMRSAGESMRDAGRQLQAGGKVAGAAGRALEGLPDFAAWANGLVYPAYLGLPNLKAVLRNTTQTVFTTIPEIGYTRGAKWAFDAAVGLAGDMKAAAKAGHNPFEHIDDQLKAVGLAGSHSLVNLEAPQTLAGGARGTINRFNELSMKLYETTDILNRALTQRMGQAWAKAIAEGDVGAANALARIGPGTKNALRTSGLAQAAGKGDPDSVAELGHTLGDYLIGRTQFRYGKEQQSEFGRTMGPLFTMFTKWPMMVASDVHDGFQRGWMHGAQHAASKYLGPWAVLHGVQAALDAAGGDHSAAYNVYVGDLPSYSPMDNIIHPTKQLEQLGGPAVQLGKGYMDALGAVGDDSSKAGTLARTATRQLLKGYVPGVSNVLNELDRWSRASDPGQATPTREFVNKLTDGP